MLDIVGNVFFCGMYIKDNFWTSSIGFENIYFIHDKKTKTLIHTVKNSKNVKQCFQSFNNLRCYY